MFSGVELISCSETQLSKIFRDTLVRALSSKSTTLKLSSELRVLKSAAVTSLATLARSLSFVVLLESIMMITFFGFDAAATYHGRNRGSNLSQAEATYPGNIPKKPLAFAARTYASLHDGEQCDRRRAIAIENNTETSTVLHATNRRSIAI